MEINTQRKNQFDYQTLQKIGRGALISGTGAAAIYALSVAGTIEAGIWTPWIAFTVPFLTNVIREFIKGETIDR